MYSHALLEKSHRMLKGADFCLLLTDDCNILSVLHFKIFVAPPQLLVLRLNGSDIGFEFREPLQYVAH